ncbi:MAG: YbjN domain-containing protein [Rhodospirillaceae bacterium]
MAVMASPGDDPREQIQPDPAQRPSHASGALFERQDQPVAAATIVDVCGGLIAGHLERLTDWAGSGWKAGDFNQYVVAATVDTGLELILTLSSEPQEDVHWRVAAGSPGTILGRERREHLARFGFLAAAEGGRWDRDIRISSPREAAAAARDLLALLTEIFGYDGQAALTFTLARGQRAEPGLLYRTLGPDDLRRLLHGWGYRAEVGTTVSGNPVVRSGAGGFKFHILFAWPTRDSRYYGCLNFVTVFLGRPNLSLSVVNEVSRSSRFARLYLDEENDLIMERDIALTGGVSAAYLHECLLDWTCMMESVTKKLERLVPAPETVPVVVH